MSLAPAFSRACWVDRLRDCEPVVVVLIGREGKGADSPLDRPVQELKDFTRVDLDSGESRNVRFVLDREKLEAFGLEMVREVQPGDFEIMVGGSSADVLKTTLVVE